MRILVPTAALLLTLTACATATSGVALPPDGRPAGSAPAAQPSSTAPTSQPKQAPKVGKPLDVDAFVQKPARLCGLVPKQLLVKHKTHGKQRLQKPEGGDAMMACAWIDPDIGGRSAGVMVTGFDDPESHGLADKYTLAEHNYWESWSETEVLGYPALNVVTNKELPQCDLVIGISDTVTLEVSANHFGKRPTACKAAEAFAEAALKSLKRAQ